MVTFRIQPVSEGIVDEIVASAGGVRAHPDANRRQKPGADYLLGDALIELKALEDEGLSKPERQRKIADLFSRYGDKSPVVVVDRDRLPEPGQREFDRLLDRPINGIIKKAKSQLQQSRSELDRTSLSILMVLNNGYTALSHDELVELVSHRVRQDTSEIDGLVIGGCYYHGDEIDSFFTWPLDYIPINANAQFRSFSLLKRAWDAYAESAMTAMVQGRLPVDVGKGPVVDTQFDVDGITYVKPAPPIGVGSGFYSRGRPRKGGFDGTNVPPVALTFPDIARSEWEKFHETLSPSPLILDSYSQWRRQRDRGFDASSPLKPFVPVQIAWTDWTQWCAQYGLPMDDRSLRRYANELFSERVRTLFSEARERKRDMVMPARYVLVVTDEIGQDRNNDLTRIALAEAGNPEDLIAKEFLLDARIFHEHGLALACAYAFAEGVDCVLWQRNLRYAWV